MNHSELPLTGPRILIRRLRLHEAASLIAYRQSPAIKRYQRADLALDLSGATHLIKSLESLQPDTPGQEFTLAIISLREQLLIGDLTLISDPIDPSLVSIGICIAEPFQRQGYGLEALNCLIHYAFGTRHKNKVRALVDARNIAYLNLLERLGFQKEALLRDHKFSEGQWWDEWACGLLRQEWLAFSGKATDPQSANAPKSAEQKPPHTNR